jgi:hypothetical protein
LKADIAPVLTKRRRIIRWFRLGSALNAAEELAHLRFQNKRVRSVWETFSQLHLERGLHLKRDLDLERGQLAGFLRQTIRTKDPPEFSRDVDLTMRNHLKSLTEQLELLKDIYHDRLSFGVQGASRVLSLIALIVAIVALLTRIPDWMWAYGQELWRWVTTWF